MTVLVQHDKDCPSKGAGHSDAAKRLSDTYRLHKAALGLSSYGRWFAAALADGTGGGQLYDCKQDAVRGQRHSETYYAFVSIGPGDMSVCEAEAFLKVNRMLYDRGIRLADPAARSGGPDVIRRAAIEDDRSLMRSIASRGRIAPSNLIMPN